MMSSENHAEELLQDLNLETADALEKQKILETLKTRLHDVVVSTVLEHMSDAEFATFKQALSSENSDEEVAVFVAKTPGLAELIEQRLKDERKLIKAVMS